MASRIIDSPIGPLGLTATEVGLAEIVFGHDTRNLAADEVGAAHRHVEQAERELLEYFAGRRTVFEVSLDRRARRGFRGVVLDTLDVVPFGHTITYGGLADRAGRPRAARAVGSAMATNPIAIIVPCHRVLPSTGGVGGYAGGAAAKALLLQLEGVEV